MTRKIVSLYSGIQSSGVAETGYTKTVLDTAPLAYWPLDDATGATSARDATGNGYDGVPSAGVTLGVDTGIGDGEKCATFTLQSYINIYSPALANAMNFDEFTLMSWFKAGTGMWTDTLEHRSVNIAKDNNALSKIGHVWTGTKFDMYRRAAGVSNGIDTDMLNLLGFTGWTCVVTVASLSGNYFKVYKNGRLIRHETGLQAWNEGAPTSNWMTIGAQTTEGSQSWLGNVAHVAWWNTPLSPATIASLAIPDSSVPLLTPIDTGNLWLQLRSYGTLFTTYNGTTPAVNNNDPVGFITDDSGHGYHATQQTDALRLTLLTTHAGPNPCLEFFDQKSVGISPSIPSGSLTIYMVVKPSTANNAIFMDSQSGRFQVGNTTANKLGWYDGGFKSIATATLDWQILCWVLTSGGNGELFKNGVSLGTAAYTATAIGGATRIGSSYSGGGPFGQEKLFEKLIYVGAHSPAQRQAMEAYLSQHSVISLSA